MNLYNNFNKQEKDLLAEANVTIENKEYSKDECKNMIFSIVDYVMNYSKNDISKNMNKYKTREWKKRIKLINKNAIVNIINTFITIDNIELLFGEQYDYIIDACDTSRVKVKLIRECASRNIKLVSSMGTAKKMDATKLIITTLDKTNTDPLAKKIRHELGKDKDLMKDVVVVTSTEKAIDTNNVLGSSAFVPGVAGLLITNYIIKDVTGM